VRVGVPRAFVADGVDDGVRRAFDAAVVVLRDAGATLVDIELPYARYAIPVYYLICTAEASSNLARYDGVKYGYRSPTARTSPSPRCTAGPGMKGLALK
jgi:aspartyl-tRNA(Asn)/glutamyl-tRNA(Gln) amidotransferase subunit A